MRERLIIILFSIVHLFTSCDFGNSGQEEHLIGKYYVGWADLEANRCIYFKETAESNGGQVIVSGYVFAVGNNSQYIIAKSLYSPAYKKIYYHIIDTKGNYNTNMDNNNYWEFSSEAEFLQSLNRLKISNIKFDKNYRADPWQ